MKDKQQAAREYILGLLEAGELDSGDKLDGARNIASRLGISFLIVQNAIATLVQDNVLQGLARKGTFVRSDWREQSLNGNIKVSATYSEWASSFCRTCEEEIPDFRLTWKFRRAPLEICTTIGSQVARNEFSGLDGIYSELCGGNDRYFVHAARPFTATRQIYGIPLSFSPRLLIYNRNMLRKAGISELSGAMTWNDFMDLVEKMKKTFAPEMIFRWNSELTSLMNPVFSGGGRFISKDSADPVRIDSPETVNALKLWQLLGKNLNAPFSGMDFKEDFRSAFTNDRLAFFFGSRMSTALFKIQGFDEWDAVPVPYIEGFPRRSVQATETLCVRTGCPEENASHFIKSMLSEKIQNEMGLACYGIPFMRSAAEKSRKLSDGRDSLFFQELDSIEGDYTGNYPELYEIICRGINSIWQYENIEEPLRELASALRTLIKIGFVSKN